MSLTECQSNSTWCMRPLFELKIRTIFALVSVCVCVCAFQASILPFIIFYPPLIVFLSNESAGCAQHVFSVRIQGERNQKTESADQSFGRRCFCIRSEETQSKFRQFILPPGIWEHEVNNCHGAR